MDRGDGGGWESWKAGAVKLEERGEGRGREKDEGRGDFEGCLRDLSGYGHG